MSEERLGPIDPDLDALLESERKARPSAEVLDRVWARVASTAAMVGPPHTQSGSWMASHPAHLAAVAFVLGGAAGAGLHATLRRPPAERVVYVSVPAPMSSSAPTIAEPSVIEPHASSPPRREPPIDPVPHASAPIAPTATATVSSSLSAERQLLDDAHAALTAGEPARALALLDEHTRRYPRPQLGEEREALAIQALATMGRYDEARARAARFRAASPNSLFLPAVDATLASIP